MFAIFVAKYHLSPEMFGKLTVHELIALMNGLLDPSKKDKGKELTPSEAQDYVDSYRKSMGM